MFVHLWFRLSNKYGKSKEEECVQLDGAIKTIYEVEVGVVVVVVCYITLHKCNAKNIEKVKYNFSEGDVLVRTLTGLGARLSKWHCTK